MNLKTAASRYGRSIVYTGEIARKVGLKRSGWWDISEEELQLIIKYKNPRPIRIPYAEQIAKESGIDIKRVRAIKDGCKLNYSQGYDKILILCKLWKTGYWKLKGLQAIANGQIDLLLNTLNEYEQTKIINQRQEEPIRDCEKLVNWV